MRCTTSLRFATFFFRLLLLANGMKLCGDAIVDAELIAAPPSTKNQEQSRDPETHQIKKGNQL